MSFDVKWNGTVIHTRDTKKQADKLAEELRTRRIKDVNAKLPDATKESRAEHVGLFAVAETPAPSADGES
jgi:hypothetical protein